MREQLQAACLVEGIELFEPIGQGGSATVYGARWRDRDVAVKVLEGRREVTAPPLEHPSILPVLAEGKALGRSYVVLERFPTDLGRLLAGRPLRRPLLRPVLVPLLEAVEFAHRRQVLHGDLKPANVLVDPGAQPPRVALADFGLGAPVLAALDASLLSSERAEQGAMGTLRYLPPERLSGGEPTPAADIYALGVLLFEVLTGRLPTGLELPSELQPDLGPRFDALVKGCLARNPGARPSAADLRRGLLRLLPSSGSGRQPREPGDDGMVRIPGGFLVIGDRDDPDARPMHEVRLRPFHIDRTMVTNLAYRAFVLATGAARPAGWPRGPRLPKRLERLPVTGVSWEEARAYAAWAGKRLPTEREWERAAQGPEQRRYPYGERLDLGRFHTDPRRLVEVGSHPAGASSEGVLDLVGNGWEWTASAFVPYGAAAPKQPKVRAIRGGYEPRRLRSGSATHRSGLRGDARDPGVGFRCARDAD
jgi:serine/threonine-protein kinase